MAKTRSEEFFTKGLMWGAILGGALFAAGALATFAVAGGPIGLLIASMFIDAIFGAVLGGVAGGVLGGVTGFFFRKDNGSNDAPPMPASTPQPAAVSAPQPAVQPQLAQGQAAPSYQELVTTSRTNATTVQR